MTEESGSSIVRSPRMRGRKNRARGRSSSKDSTPASSPERACPWGRRVRVESADSIQYPLALNPGYDSSREPRHNPRSHNSTSGGVFGPSRPT